MKPGVFSALSCSLFLHAVIITLFFYLGREFYTHRHVMEYSVSLISPSESGESEKGPGPSAADTAEQQEEQQKVEKPVEKARVEKEKSHAPLQAEAQPKKKADTSLVKERIEELKAIQKLERLAELRKVIDIGGAGQQSSKSKTAASSQGRGNSNGGTNDYYALVASKIEQHWVFPDTASQDLKTIVSIKIAADGSITIEKVEKRSGNRLFDLSVLRAINLASPLPRPLKEMEMGLRFNPSQLRIGK